MAEKEKVNMFGINYWVYDDIANLRKDLGLPAWSKTQCEEYLERMDGLLIDAAVEAGWRVLEEDLTE